MGMKNVRRGLNKLTNSNLMAPIKPFSFNITDESTIFVFRFAGNEKAKDNRRG